MKSPCIELGLGDTIECWYFVRAIAKATHPTLEDAVGIDCVIGKFVSHVKDDELLKFSCELTDDERASLEPLLKNLPKLQGKMSDLEIDTFLNLYSALPNRLLWLPRLNSRADIDRVEFEQWDRQADHREQLQQRLQDGKIQAFDAHHFPAKRIGPNVFIPRKQAVAYLQECGIQICSANESKNLSEIVLSNILQPDVSDSSENEKVIHQAIIQQSSLPPTDALDKDRSVTDQQSPAEGNVQRSLGKMNEKNLVSHRRPRKDGISRAILIAQSKCTNPLDETAVWDALKAMAANKVPPLKSADDLFLSWEYAPGRSSEFSRNSLRMRLYRQLKK